MPRDLSFEYNKIQFVIIKTTAVLEFIPNDIKNEIGIKKFIIMDNYKLIELLWPVYKM